MSILNQFELLRKKLIDTGLRNRMLNYKLSRASGVAIEGEDPDQVYSMLVTDGKKMQFTGQPDGVEISQSEADLEFEEESDASGYVPPESNLVDRTDNKLNTPHRNKVLSRRLLKTSRDAQELYEETGLNVLYLAFGSLIWNQSKDENSSYVAPLVFVPVKMERDNAGRFRIEYSGEDLGDNLSLRVKLKDDFGIDLPTLVEDESIKSYAEKVSDAVKNQEQWHVDSSSIVLGFFQFTKLVMYQDLRQEDWPEALCPTEDSDLKAILGDGYPSLEETISEDDSLDEFRTPAECKEIYSSDSSQSLAIVRALDGRSMVIEGPPGTGKSQTIANLIAEYVAQGKKVLFVSEKMAALNVVYRRLESAGLADACLELHSRASRRKEFYSELKRIMALRGDLASADAELTRLEELRSKLNQYAGAINTIIEPWGLTPHQAIGMAGLLPKESTEDIPFRVPFETIKQFKYDHLKKLYPTISAYQNLLKQIGVPSQHPFAGCAIRVVTPGLNLELHADLDRVEKLLEQFQALSASLAKSLCIEPVSTPSDMSVVTACVRRAIEAPKYDGVAVKQDSWQQELPIINETIGHLQSFNDLRNKRSAQVQSSIWNAELKAIIDTLESWAPKWYRFVSSEYKLRLKELQAHLVNPASVTPIDALLIAKDVAASQVCESKIASQSATMSRLFGVQWQGVHSDPSVIKRLCDWCLELRGAVSGGEVPKGILDFFSANHDDMDLSHNCDIALQLMNECLELCKSTASKLQFNGDNFSVQPFTVTREQINRWKINLHRLSEATQYNILSESMREQALGHLVDLSSTWPDAQYKLQTHIERSYYEGILKFAVSQSVPLQAFDRNQHEEALKEFDKLDDYHLLYNRARVKHAHLRSQPNWNIAGGNSNLIKMQCELRRGHKPIRWALEKAGSLIQQMKPVFLMSPLSVAQFLPRDSVRFDVVIFDEASQIKPEDALSAVARADQTIVVGDSKQMPPTAFFDKLVGEFEGEDEQAQAVGQQESLLALMSASVRGTTRSTDLRWHYRSLHPALIRPSNSEFYDNRLVVFPSPILEGAEGLKFHHSGQEIYERGASRKNPLQAKRVANAVIQHFKDKPSESLIVVAFSKQQEEAIEDELEVLLRDQLELLHGFNARHPFEKFDVKNLESVQGDERDVVYISVGYGPDEKGFISMNFGPINSSGGDRRLNVLMSRARKRCEVFSSIRAADFRINESPQPGVVLLKKFLQFAESGELDDPRPMEREEDSVFERQVADALRRNGQEVDVQVGSIGFFIDMAIRHPQYPGRYVLGIECDGATYHSAKSARDRDKLRQAALEARGWKLHRIWSTDWWQNPEGEIQRCLGAIERAILTYDQPNPFEDDELPQEILAPEFIIDIAPVVSGTNVKPYQVWDRPFNLQGHALQELDPATVGRCVLTIVAFEGPLHEDVLINRIRTSANLGRAGSVVRHVIEQGIKHAASQRLIEHREKFVYPSNWTCSAIRDVSNLAQPLKNPEWVAPEELTFAFTEIVSNSFGIEQSDAISRAWRMIGFAQCTARMTSLGQNQLDKLIAQGRFAVSEGGLLSVKG